MSKIKFEKAMLLIAGEFMNQPSWWPEWFPTVNLAVLQSPLKDDISAWQAEIELAVKTGGLASTLKPYLLRPPFFVFTKEFSEQGILCDELTVTAPDFAAWLTKQGEKPSELIAAWFAAVGDQAKDGDNAPAQTAAMPAPVVAVDASDAPAILKNQRPDLLTPLIEKAQSGETNQFSTAVIWAKLCDMAESKTTPFIGKTESGLKWIDANDDSQFLTKGALGDRLRRQKTRDRA